MPKFLKVILIFLALIILAAAIVVAYFFVGKAQVQSDITWGVDFSQSHAEYLKLNWKEAYLAIIDDLGVKDIKLHTNWSWIEIKKDNYFFDDVDWQIKQAEEKDVKIIYVVGAKTGHWPECHIPDWAANLSKEEQQAQILKYVKEVVSRYKDSKAVAYWQIENEPLFPFGECPSWYYKDKDFLKKEVALVRSLDPGKQIIISDSGEQSMWFGVAQVGDIVGITMYRSVWTNVGNLLSFGIDYFFSPVTYARKADIIKMFFDKKVICIELQAEPWVGEPLMEASLPSQLVSMNLERFKKNVEYAKETGLDRFYFWGVEWWYQMKTQYDRPEIWNEAKTLFVNK